MTAKRPRAERRREIAETALRLAEERGVSSVTTAALAREVGLAEGTLFRHFANKEAILLEALERLDGLLATALPEGVVDPLARLGRHFVARVELLVARPGLLRLLVSEELALAAGPDGARAARRVQRRTVGFVRAALGEAHARGLLRAGLRPDDLVVIIDGAAYGLVSQSRVVSSATPPEQRARQVWSILEAMMREKVLDGGV